MPRLVLIVVAVLAAAAVLVLAFPGSGERGVRNATPSLATIEPVSAPPAEGLALPPRTGDEEHEVAAARVPADLRRRIAGSVVVEGGLPEEEIAVVASRGRRPRPRDRCRARVAPDGSFEILLGEGAGPVLLDIVAPSLRLPQPRRALPGELDVVLRAERAPCLEVQLLRRGGILPGSDPWWDVFASLSAPSGTRGAVSRRRGNTMLPDAAGRMVFRSLAIGQAFELVVSSPQGPVDRAIAPLAPGEHRRIDVVLERGSMFSGTVVDQDGLPVVDAEIEARPTPAVDGSPDAATDAAGRFELAGLPGASYWQLTALAEDIFSCAPVTVAGDAGDVDGIVIQVERGLVLTGSVVWPDGTPASGFLLVRDTEAATESVQSGEVGTGGFLVSLRPGTYELDVHARRDGWLGTARVPRVRPGGPALALVLDEQRTFAVAVTATDLQGVTLRTFTAVCRLPGDAARSRGSTEGSLVLDGLPAGTHEVEVRAEGCYPTTRLVQVGPGLTDPLAFVLSPCGVVRGRVVDASGNPVPRARVRAQARGGVTCDEDGRFEVRLARSPEAIHAVANGVRSARVPVEVPSGGVLEGVLLRLGGRVPGR